MPTHLHVADPDEATPGRRRAFARLLTGLGARIEIVLPTWIADDRHLARTIRYIHLNPCRDGLCHDPLEWEWSTHRDYAGLVTCAWPNVKRVFPRIGFREFDPFHRFVSSDPSVHPSGSMPPLPFEAIRPVILDLAAVERAAVIAERSSRDAFRRKGHRRARLLRALKGLGVPGVSLARHFAVDPSAVKAPRPADLEWIQPILRIQADPRLLRGGGKSLKLEFRHVRGRLEPRELNSD